MLAGVALIGKCMARVGCLFVFSALLIGPMGETVCAQSAAGTVPSPAQESPAAPGVAPAGAGAPTVAVAVPIGGAVVHTQLPSDLSVTSMFEAADPIVKGVMGMLAAASVATWAIFIYKLIELARARSSATRDLRAIAGAGSLAQAAKALSGAAVSRLTKSAELEIAASQALPSSGVKERVAIALQRVEADAARRIGAGTGILASVGSTGPFVGLFGTVWGIMNSFIHISNAHTTNLAVVAPGIAEALLATAMGLVAAIPAVVIYNVFSRGIAAYRAVLGDASASILRHVSRDLDRSDQGQFSQLAAE